MPSPLLHFFIIDYFSDSLEFQVIDINKAGYQELSSIPLLTDEDIQKILRQRPYSSFKEFADSLNLTPFERGVLRNYVFVSKIKRYSVKLLSAFRYDSTIDLRYSAFFGYKNFLLRAYRNKVYFGYGNFYFGNLKFAKGIGLIGSSYYRSNTKRGIYFSDNLGGILNFGNLDAFLDSSKNYLLLYNFKNSYFGFLGKDNVNLFIGLDYKLFAVELLRSENYLNYAYSLNVSNDLVGVRVVYKRIFENYWDYVNADEKFYIVARFNYDQFRIYSRFSDSYQYHSISYNITDASKLELRLSETSHKLEFSNEEGLTFAIFKENAIKIGYKFVSVYQYKDLTSICDEYIPLYGCYIRLDEDRNYKFALNFRYKLFGLFATSDYLYTWISLALNF